ncbi:hypothetical protein CBL_05200 [Carabus blaptoides fortunei]
MADWALSSQLTDEKIKLISEILDNEPNSRESERLDETLGERVVNKLISTARGKDITFCFDRFFASTTVLQYTTYAVALGTCNRNRRYLPKIKDKLKRGEYLFQCRKDEQLFVKWQDTKEVLMLSNCHNAAVVSAKKTVKDGSKISVPCPQMVASYREFMEGVDLADQLLGLYELDRKSNKWIQLKSQKFQTTEDLLAAMKSYADELPSISPTVPNKQKKAEPTEKNKKRNCPKKKEKPESRDVNLTQTRSRHIPSVRVAFSQHEFNALVDSGSSANIIRQHVAKKTNLKIEPDHQVYTGLGMSSVHSLGQAQVTVCVENESYNLNFSVVPDSTVLHDVILGEPFFHVAVVSFGPNGMKISKWPDEIQAEMNEILQIEGQQPGPPLMVNPNINPKNELQLFNMLSEYEDTLQEPEPVQPKKRIRRTVVTDENNTIAVLAEVAHNRQQK